MCGIMSKEKAGEILRLSKVDEKEAFRLLFDTYYVSLVLFACRIVGSRAEAEDVVQDVLVGFWTKRGFAGVARAVDGYLFEAVKNRALDHLKSAGRRQISRPLDSETELPALNTDEIDTFSKLYRAIEMLPDQRQRIFKMVYVDGYKYHEVAEMLGISVNTVQTQLRRGLQFLRGRLAGDGDDTRAARKELLRMSLIFFRLCG